MQSDVGAGVGAFVGGMATHSVALVAPFVHIPPLHITQAEADVFSWNLPEGQWEQVVLPSTAANLPALQCKHTASVLKWNCPWAHFVHEAEPTPAYCPFGHAEQKFEFWLIENLPALQRKQPTWPKKL